MKLGDQSTADAGDVKVGPYGTYRDSGGAHYVDTGRRSVIGFQCEIVPYKSMVDIDKRPWKAFRPDRLWVDPAIARFFELEIRVGICSQTLAPGGTSASYYAIKGGRASFRFGSSARVNSKRGTAKRSSRKKRRCHIGRLPSTCPERSRATSLSRL